MRSTHVRAFPPFLLNGVPSVFGRPCGDHTKASYIRAIKRDMASRKLITKSPLVEGGVAGVNGGIDRLDRGGLIFRVKRKWNRLWAGLWYVSVNIAQ